MSTSKQDLARGLVRGFISEVVIEDVTREGLKDTPDRVTKAWREYWAAGYSVDPASLLKTFEDGSEGYEGLIIQCGIAVHSHCEHHMAPFWGEAHIGYLPGKRIVGLSKLARVVRAYAQRLQVQERLTTQVADLLYSELEAKGVGVILRCRHMCLESRGVQMPGTITITSSLRGCFGTDEAIRSEFLSLRTHGKGAL